MYKYLIIDTICIVNTTTSIYSLPTNANHCEMCLKADQAFTNLQQD